MLKDNYHAPSSDTLALIPLTLGKNMVRCNDIFHVFLHHTLPLLVNNYMQRKFKTIAVLVHHGACLFHGLMGTDTIHMDAGVLATTQREVVPLCDVDVGLLV